MIKICIELADKKLIKHFKNKTKKSMSVIENTINKEKEEKNKEENNLKIENYSFSGLTL
jgi:hypothetical protein